MIRLFFHLKVFHASHFSPLAAFLIDHLMTFLNLLKVAELCRNCSPLLETNSEATKTTISIPLRFLVVWKTGMYECDVFLTPSQFHILDGEEKSS